VVSASAAWAAAATLIATAFALSTFERWQARRRRHERAWTVSLAMFAVASAALWWGAGHGWDAATFRVFFLFGACLNVPWLALGSVELLYGERVGRAATTVVALVSAFAAGVLTVAPLKGSIPRDDLPQGKDVFGVLPRVFAGVFSGVGATVVVVLAVLSAVRVWRGSARTRRTAATPLARPGRLVAGNLLIALGTLVLGASGTLNGRLGAMNAFSITLVVGIAVLFVGFLVATTASSPSAAAPALTMPPPIAALLDEVDRELASR